MARRVPSPRAAQTSCLRSVATNRKLLLTNQPVKSRNEASTEARTLAPDAWHQRELCIVKAVQSTGNIFPITIALAGHADRNSMDCCTPIGTCPLVSLTNPNLGKKDSAVVVSK
jgi:hypothetical protein